MTLLLLGVIIGLCAPYAFGFLVMMTTMGWLLLSDVVRWARR